MSITSKGKRWELLHSLWIGWTFTLSFFNWIAFFYIALRAKRKRWAAWGLLYSVPFVLAMIFAGGPAFAGWIGDAIVALTLLLGAAGIFHAFWIRKEYLLRLDALQRRKGESDMLLKRRLAAEHGKETWQEDAPSPTASSPMQATPERGQEVGAEPPTTESPSSVRTAFQAERNSARQAQLAATSMSPAESERPSPSKTDTLVPYEKLFKVCVKYLSDGYYVGDAIPPKKLDGARASFPIPETERVVALIDTTVFGNNKTGLAFCEGGIYWRNDWTTKTNRTFLSWDEFASSTLTSEGKPSGTVELGEGSVLNLSGSPFKREDAVGLLLEVQSLAKIVVRASRVETASGGETDERKRVAEAVTDRRRAEKTTASPSEPSASPTPSFNHENRALGREGPPHPGTGSSLPLKYPIPLAYSYRLVEAEFETLRILKGDLSCR